MSNLSVFSALHERVKKYKIDYSLESESYAFSWLALETILQLTESEIDEAITDGSMDGGIDAIYIDGRDVHIFTFKYTEKFDNTKKNFPGNDLDTICVTMDRIYGKSIKKNDINPVLYDKIVEIWELFDEGQLFFNYYICSNKLPPVQTAKDKFENHLEKYRNVSFYYYGLEDILNKILSQKFTKVNGEVTFIDKQYFERTDGPLKGIVATISAIDLIQLVADKEHQNTINSNVFNDNVRTFLKLKNRINKNIYDTALSDSNHEFWYLNNGITIVCEGCDFTPNMRSPKVKLDNFQIVNGGQTTNALYEAYLTNKDKLENVDLLIRICQTTKTKISEKISETTNSQNPVRSRDLHANDTIQKRLELEFESLGYYYERKKNQHDSELRSKILNNEILGQLYMAYYLDMPSDAKNTKSLVFGEKYDDIFHENITAQQLLVPYYYYIPLEYKKKEIQRKKRSKEDFPETEAFLSRAIFHILMVVKYISESLEFEVVSQEQRDGVLENAIDLMKNIVIDAIEKRKDRYSSDKFFKELATNKIVLDKIKETLQKKDYQQC